MRHGKAFIGGLAALSAMAGGALAEERLVLEAYPVAAGADPWQVVTDRDLGGRFYVEMMPADQTEASHRDTLAAASFPGVKASAAEVLQGALRDFQAAQHCEGIKVTEPTVAEEQGRPVAYAQAYCGQLPDRPFGVQVFYKAIQGADGVYVVSRDFRTPPSKEGGALSFAEGDDEQGLALLKSVAAANAWLSGAVYVCGPGAKDPRCSRPAPAGARSLVSGAALEALTRSASYQAVVAKAMAALSPDVTKGCKAVGGEHGSIRVLKPISFAADGQPVDGAWKQSFAQDRCGEPLVLNFQFTATADKRIRTLILVPGDDIAEPPLQVQAFRSAMAGIQAAAPACQSGLHVLNTRFDGFDHTRSPGADPPPGTRVEIPWRETWTLGGCGQAWTAPLAFTPDGATTRVEAGAPVRKP